MSNKNHAANHRGPMRAVLALLAGLAATPLWASDFFDYKGSLWCTECHIDKYSSVQGHRHGKMFATCEESLARALPLPGGHTCEDVGYVIGGNGWKARYLDPQGYFITSFRDREGNESPGMNQWNIGTGRWSDYHPGETGIPYDCGACHTTGWKADLDADTDGTLADNQDGVPGIHGTFEEAGVQCEACHGPGYTMFVDETAAFCGTCHSREPVKTIQASDGFIRHQQQYNELLASPHSKRTCISCHNPHESGENGIQRTCETCHSPQAASYEGTKMQLAGVQCADCHMPKASKSGETDNAYVADVRTHIFRIRTDPNFQNMFNTDGTAVRKDSDGQSAISLDFACKGCHAGQETGWLAHYAQNFHDRTWGITAAMSGTWWAGAERSGEGWLLDAAANGFVASMYTYDAAGDQAWLFGAGEPDGDLVTVDLVITEGAVFGGGFDPDDVARTPWGTATFLFVSCTEATVELEPTAEMEARGFEAMTVNIERLTTSAISCQDPG